MFLIQTNSVKTSSNCTYRKGSVCFLNLESVLNGIKVNVLLFNVFNGVIVAVSINDYITSIYLSNLVG